jgi:hypothetical protein
LVRQLIISGINCLNLQNESFVPHYDLLPNSFIENLEILSNLKSCQEKLPPIPPEKITQFLVGSYEVYEFIKRESIETWNKIIELENKFLREKYNIEAENFIITQPRYDLTKYRFVSEKWLLSIKDVDKDWFNNAKRLNKVRNRAAHVRNESEILEAFGISGDNKISLLRNMCIEIITKSLGLVQNEK